MRFSGKGQPYEGLVEIKNGHPQWTGKIRTVPEALAEPLHWRKPQRIFVNSMSDLFHPDVPIDFIARMFNVMTSATPECGKNHKHEEECWTGEPHQFLILTKRPERMREVMATELSRATEYMSGEDCLPLAFEFGWPPKNIWLGVSVEDQATADERIPLLLETPAAVRWVSYEPALGQVDFRLLCRSCEHFHKKTCHRLMRDRNGDFPCLCPAPFESWALDWVVAGGESGPGARPAHPDWFRRVRDDCQAAGVPFFFKQWGEWSPGYQADISSGALVRSRCQMIASEDYPEQGIRCEVGTFKVGKKRAGRLLDGREWNEFPQSLNGQSPQNLVDTGHGKK